MTIVRIDVREIERLRAGLIAAGVGFQRSEAILAQSLNRAGQRSRTAITRKVVQWTGIRRRGEIFTRIKPVIARPGAMRTGTYVASPHLKVTKGDFGATWNRSWPGGRHAAWSRRVTAKRSFMVPGRDHLVVRMKGQGRRFKPLWGPNIAREIHRHSGEVQAILTREAIWFRGEAVRRAHVELMKAKAQYAL